MNTQQEIILKINNLSISFTTFAGEVNAIRGIDLELHRGETMAIVGESGSGKSVTVKSILGIMDKNEHVRSGSILFTHKDEKGNIITEDLLKCKESVLQKRIRGKHIALVFQDPMTSLNPTMTIGAQIVESVLQQKGIRKAQAKQRAIELLQLVGITDAEKRFGNYPHQLSGGMRQRVVIAIALACEPDLLICDEPTTALDVTIQAQILELLQQLSQDMGMSILLITHNFGVVAETCQRTSVMYAGKVVETGETRELLRSARHPYSRALIRSIPGGGARGSRLETIPGSPPALFEPPASCMFAPRCPYADETCRTGYPAMADCGDGHLAACFKPLTEEVSAHV